MKKIVEKLLKATSGAKPVYFERSQWFEDETPAQIRKIIKTYEKHYQTHLSELIELLGQPIQTEKTGSNDISKWFPEAIRAACWNKEGKTICLTLEQHDQENPVGVVLRCLTEDEIAELCE